MGKDHFRGTSDELNINDNAMRIDVELSFKLVEPIEVCGEIQESKNIRIVRSKENEKIICEFRVKIYDYNEKKSEDAIQQIKRLLNWMSWKMGRKIDHRREIIVIRNDEHEKLQEKVLPAAEFNLDLNSTEMASILKNEDQKLTQKLAVGANGIKSYEERNYTNAIRDFYLVIQESKGKLDEKHRALRNGLSHFTVSRDNIEALEKCFGLKLGGNLETHKYIDMNDYSNIEILNNQARDLGSKMLETLS